MRSFDDERWPIPGPRWIAQLPLGSAALDLGDRYAAGAQRWWSTHHDPRPFDQVFAVLPRDLRHVTLTLVDRPAANVSSEQELWLRDAIDHEVRQFEPFDLVVGPAIPSTFTIELYLAPHPTLTALREAIASAYRTVFGASAQPEPRNKPWRAHTSIGYCREGFDHESLASALLRTPGPDAGYLGPVTNSVDRVLLAATDAWSTAGFTWDCDTAHHLPLGTRTIVATAAKASSSDGDEPSPVSR